MSAKKTTTNRLQEKAMLIHLSISSWQGRHKDNSISQEVKLAKKADDDAGAWWTYLVPKSDLDPVAAARMRCRAVWIKHTLPWIDGGIRILPSARYIEYTEAMRKARTDYEDVVKVFVRRYPEVVAEAKTRLGKLLDGVTLPSVTEIKTKFQVRHTIIPVPAVSDFRVDIGSKEAASIKKEIAESMNGMLEKAMTDVWQRLDKLVGKVAETMKAPDKKFKDSLISNLKEFCDLIPKINLTDDAKLEQMRKEIKKSLTTLKPGMLRDSKKDRKAAAKTANDILSKMKAYTKK